jgi:AcrR family transcriptional regulator
MGAVSEWSSPAGSAPGGEPEKDASAVGRPSVASARTEQILDALEATVAEHGLENATLQRIADRAGVTRSAIGHFIGNRDELINAAADRSVGRIHEHFDDAIRSVPPEERVELFIDLVFRRERKDREAILDLNDELIALAHRDPHARDRLAHLYTGFEEMIRAMLEDQYPNASDEQVAAVAVTSVLLLREADRVSVLGLTAHPEDVRPQVTWAVRLLIGSLTAEA